MKYLVNLDLNQNQLLNAVIQNLAVTPAAGAGTAGQQFYHTVEKIIYTHDGTNWVAGVSASGATPADGSVTNAKLAAMPAKTFKGNDTTGSAAPKDLTQAEATALLNAATTSLQGAMSAADKTKVDHLTVTAATNLDTLRSDTATNNAKVSNATHTGDVTGSVALAITDKAVTNAKLADMAANTLKGVTADGVPQDLSVASVNSMLGTSTAITQTHTHANKATLDTYTQTEANLADAVSKKHSQNTDVGTSSATFYLNGAGVKLKDVGGELQIRNNADDAAADLRVNNLTVLGAQTIINSNTVEIGDNQIVLNADIATSAANSDGGIAIKRLMANNSTRKDAELNFNNSTGKWQSTHGPVTGTLITAQIANKVTAAIGDGSATSIIVTHNLNSRDLTVAVREAASPYALVIPDVEFTTVDTITFKFAVAPTSGQYRVAIVG